MKEILLDQDANSNGLNALNYSAKWIHYNNERAQLFPFLFFKIYCKHLDLEEFIYEKDSEGFTLLHSMTSRQLVPVIKLVLTQIKAELSVQKFKQFLRLRNNAQQNLLHLIADSRFTTVINEKLDFIINLLDIELNSQEIKEMLTEKDKYELFPLHSLIRKSRGFEKSILSFYLKFFSVNEIDSMIKSENSEGFIFKANTINILCKRVRRLHNESFEN